MINIKIKAVIQVAIQDHGLTGENKLHMDYLTTDSRYLTHVKKLLLPFVASHFKDSDNAAWQEETETMRLEQTRTWANVWVKGSVHRVMLLCS